jgi:flagellar hook-associated protein 3 FlgL
MTGMRISTAMIYQSQTNSMLNDQAQITNLASELSSGISLNSPSDDPLHIGQALDLKGTIAQENTDGSIAQIASNQLSTTDGALSQLTSIMQSANTLAVQGATDALGSSERNDLGDQVDKLLGEAISIANTKYNGKYIFGGTSVTQQGPVTAIGNPATGVQITGNDQVITQQFSNGQSLQLSTSLNEAFNTGAADGSSSVFQTLINLRDALQGKSITVSSANSLNTVGSVIGATTQLGAASFSTPITGDSNGNYAMQLNGPAGSATLTFGATNTIQDVVDQINASGTGVSAAYNTTTEKISLTSTTGSFILADTPSAGATTSGNILEALGLPTTASTTTDVSGQIGDVQSALNAVLSARSSIGVNIQALSAVESQSSASATTDTASLSSIQDTNIQQATTQFSLAQTALQAAYLTTSKIESTNLFNYVSSGS